MRILPALLLVACGGDDTTADSGTDSAATSDSGGPLDSGSQDLRLLTAWVDHSVNDATAGWSDAAQVLLLETNEGTHPPGSFNGVGTGSKAIAGLPGQGGTWLNALEGITVDAKLASGEAHFYLNVLVDLACDGVDVRILVVDETTFGDPVAGEGDWDRYTASADQPQWKAVGGLDDLLPTHTGGDGRPLGPVVEAYPGACLADADTGDGGMPKGVVTSSVMVILGDSANTEANRWGVNRVGLNDIAWVTATN